MLFLDRSWLEVLLEVSLDVAIDRFVSQVFQLNCRALWSRHVSLRI
jgi:hypothetical protein